METQGGNTGLIAHTIGNPDRRIAGYRAIEEMMLDIKKFGQDNGYIAFMCLTRSRLLDVIYKRVGFVLSEPNTNQYLMV
jgi:hypothetical protein